MTASDGTNSGSDSILFSFAPTNDPPTIVSPVTQSVTEDTDLVFSAANGNAIVIDDPDSDELAAPNNVVRVSLSVNSGVLTLSTNSDLDFSLDGNVGDGTGDSSMIFRGTLSAVNTALAGLVYRGNSNFNSSGSNAAEVLSIVVNDLGNAGQDPSTIGEPDTGDTTSEEATANVTINVTAVNDEPVNSTPGLQVIVQDTSVSFNTGNGNAIVVSDIDVDETVSPNNLLQVTLAANNGATVTLTSTTGLDFGFNDASGTGDNNGADGTMVFRGTVTDLNNALNSLTVTPAGGFTGNVDLVVTTSDLGNTGLDTTTAPTTNFNIEINYPDSSITTSQQAVIEQAIQKWEEVIIDNGLSLAIDLTISATATANDGVGGTLATGGPNSFHSGTNMSSTGTLTFDIADIANQEASGELFVLALHELGHALGLGTRWLNAGLVNVAETEYTGAKALAAYNFLFGTSVSFVPVEDDGGAAGSHWEETEGANPLTTELLTGTQDSASDPLSILSIGSLEDLGYQVNYLGADTFNGISGAAYLSFLSVVAKNPMSIRSLSTLATAQHRCSTALPGRIRPPQPLPPMPWCFGQASVRTSSMRTPPTSRSTVRPPQRSLASARSMLRLMTSRCPGAISRDSTVWSASMSRRVRTSLTRRARCWRRLSRPPMKRSPSTMPLQPPLSPLQSTR